MKIIRYCGVVISACALGVAVYSCTFMPSPPLAQNAVPSAKPVETKSIETEEANSTALLKAWEQYVATPNDKTAEAVYKLLPTGDTYAPGPLSTADDVREKIYTDLNPLSQRVKGGNSIDTRIALRLLNIADGDFAESLEVMLGALIAKRAPLFLQELKTINGNGFCPMGLVANLGEDFVDNYTGELKELKLRAAALKAVTDKRLADIKATCLRVLNQAIQDEERLAPKPKR